jgi:hypothetical protein
MQILCLQGAAELSAGAGLLSRPADEYGNDASINSYLYLSILF